MRPTCSPAKAWRSALLGIAAASGVLCFSSFVLARGGDGEGAAIAPLSSLPVPKPSTSEIISQAAAIRLGKALFWDMQVGSDGQVACATCHLQPGTDTRRFNTVNPGPNGNFEVVGGPGELFGGGSFSSDDIVGSQGVVGGIFNAIASDPHQAADDCSPDESAPFHANRRVTGRQAPTTIGAVYNRNNFWDGRANHQFNGLSPFGATGNANGQLGTLVENSSLASQAVGPALSSTEMSCANRGFNGANSLGMKMLARTPLQFQTVDPTDSVLGRYSAYPAKGLTVSYRQMIQAAFGPALAKDAENYFSRIWGLAVQAYESTLIADRTPMDLYLAGNRNALTEQQAKGLDIFQGKGGCTNCHTGPTLSDATVAIYATRGAVNEDGGDQGFHNIGVRPTAEDLGRAGLGPNGRPWAENNSPANHGAFKTPTLRNVKLTAPYFHTGGKATLGDVVDFYARGGDFANPEKSKRMKPISFSAGDKAALVDFLTNGLTDCRVEMERAPFDHPSLALPNGANLAATGALGRGACN
jgi:cytochrome c peroxidase